MTSLVLDQGEPEVSEPEVAHTPQTRIVDAALRCIARWGLSKTTVDDIAREAGIGRATLYRLFPGGRDAVLDGVVTTETARFLARLVHAVGTAGSLEDALVTIIAEAGQTLDGHEALRFVLAHEPEVILPHISFQQMDVVLRVVAASVGPMLQPWLPAGTQADTAARGAEWLGRIVLSYLFAPSPDVSFADDASIRHLVRTYVLPGLTPATP